ncbi:FAD-dependent oxidoreductase, partial [Enterobacter asburiae]
VDDARLTLALVRTAAFHGAAVVNHAQAIDTTRDGHGKVNGARVRADDREIAVKARVVIMATGVWLRDWNGQKKGAPSALQIRPAKGVHVAIPWLKIRNDCTVT